MEQVTLIINAIVNYIPLATTIVGVFALIATQTPNKADDRIVQVILDVINFLGANLGKSRNAD